MRRFRQLYELKDFNQPDLRPTKLFGWTAKSFYSTRGKKSSCHDSNPGMGFYGDDNNYDNEKNLWILQLFTTNTVISQGLLKHLSTGIHTGELSCCMVCWGCSSGYIRKHLSSQSRACTPHMLNAIYSNNCIFTRAPYFLCANELSVIEI